METKLEMLDRLKRQLGEAKSLKLTVENHLERLTSLRKEVREVLVEIDPYTGELRQVFDKLIRSLFDPIRERIIVKYVPANNDVEYKRAFDKKVAEIEAYLDSITEDNCIRDRQERGEEPRIKEREVPRHETKTAIVTSLYDAKRKIDEAIRMFDVETEHFQIG